MTRIFKKRILDEIEARVRRMSVLTDNEEVLEVAEALGIEWGLDNEVIDPVAPENKRREEEVDEYGQTLD